MSPEELRARREAAGLSTYQLAARAGVAPNTVLRAETGQVVPRGRTLRALLAALEGRQVAPPVKSPPADVPADDVADVVRLTLAADADGRRAIRAFAAWVASGGFVPAHDITLAGVF